MRFLACYTAFSCEECSISPKLGPRSMQAAIQLRHKRKLGGGKSASSPEVVWGRRVASGHNTGSEGARARACVQNLELL